MEFLTKMILKPNWTTIATSYSNLHRNFLALDHLQLQPSCLELEPVSGAKMMRCLRWVPSLAWGRPNRRHRWGVPFPCRCFEREHTEITHHIPPLHSTGMWIAAQFRGSFGKLNDIQRANMFVCSTCVGLDGVLWGYSLDIYRRVLGHLYQNFQNRKVDESFEAKQCAAVMIHAHHALCSGLFALEQDFTAIAIAFDKKSHAD